MAASMSDTKLAPRDDGRACLFGADRRPTGAVVPPLHAATTYARDENYQLPKTRREN